MVFTYCFKQTIYGVVYTPWRKRVTEPRVMAPRNAASPPADVERAADALLRQGSRPTIEKVRAEIGSGSPNTINPLLDDWWQRLASRLDAGPAALHRLPEGVLHVAEALWLQALDEGRQRARLELVSSKRAADEEQRRHEVRSHVLTLREAELDERVRSRERALEESREQLLQLMSAGAARSGHDPRPRYADRRAGNRRRQLPGSTQERARTRS